MSSSKLILVRCCKSKWPRTTKHKSRCKLHFQSSMQGFNRVSGISMQAVSYWLLNSSLPESLSPELITPKRLNADSFWKITPLKSKLGN